MGGGVMGDGGWLQQLMKYIKQSYIPTLPGFNQVGHSRPTHIAASLYTVYQEQGLMYTVYTAYMCVIIIYNMYICIYSMYREPVWELIGRGGIENGNTNNKENIYILYFTHNIQQGCQFVINTRPQCTALFVFYTRYSNGCTNWFMILRQKPNSESRELIHKVKVLYHELIRVISRFPAIFHYFSNNVSPTLLPLFSFSHSAPFVLILPLCPLCSLSPTLPPLFSFSHSAPFVLFLPL